MKRFPTTTARTHPASRTPAGTFAMAIAAAVLAVLLLLSVPQAKPALAQEAPSGIDVGEGSVSINDGQVFAGDGCAKAGDVVAGDCEDGKAKKDGAPKSGAPQSSGDDAGSDGAEGGPAGGQYDGEDGSESEDGGAGEATVLESTTASDGSDEAGEESTQSQVTETTTESTTDVVEGSGAGSPAAPDPAAEDPDAGCAAEGPMGETTMTTVERAIDGDTVETTEGTVRLIGVDTPETVDPDEGPEPGGKDASAFTAAELEGEDVELEPGTEPEDGYGRDLAYLWVEDESGELAMFNETLLREGLGQLLIIPPNDEYERCLAAAEKAAHDTGLGVWADGAAGAERVPPDAPSEPQTAPETTAPEGSNSPTDDEPSDVPAQDQYDGEAAQSGPAQPEDAAPSATEDQYEEEAGAEATPPAPTDEPEIQEEEEIRQPRARNGELADDPADPPARETAQAPDQPVAQPPLEASAELSADDAGVPATSAPAAPVDTAAITTLPETGGASAISLAAGTLLVCSGLLVGRLARASRGPREGGARERARG